MSEHDDRAQDGTDPTYPDGDASGSSAVTPAAYPPPAPYPPASSEPAAPAAGQDTPAPHGQDTPAPYGQGTSQPYGQGSSSQPYGQGSTSQPYGQGTSQPYGQPGYGGPVAPEQGQQPYGQQVPYGQGYGQSASYTTTPQPYAYGPPPLSPDAEKVRSSAVLWTVLNGVAIFLCGNLLAIPGVILAALAIGRAREDVPAARNLVRWSWIVFAAGFALALLALVAYIVFFVVVGTASMSSGF